MSVFVVIDGQELQIDNDVLASKYHDDIEKMDKSFSPHTKDITLPDTPDVRKALGYLSDRFVKDAKYRFEASIEKDLQEIFKGDLVVLEAYESNANKVGKYDCQMIAGLGTTIESAKNTMLSDMLFTNFHLGPVDIVNSWFTDDVEYFWWLLDKGDIDFDSPAIVADVSKFKPFAYIPKMVKRFLEEQGYFVAFKGDFAQSRDFQQAAVCDNSPRAYVERERARMYHNTHVDLGDLAFSVGPAATVYDSKVAFNNEVDVNNEMDLPNNEFVCPFDDLFTVQMQVKFSLDGPYAQSISTNDIQCYFTLYDETASSDVHVEQFTLIDNGPYFWTPTITKTKSLALTSGHRYSMKLKIVNNQFGGETGYPLGGAVGLNMTNAMFSVKLDSVAGQFVDVAKSMPNISMYDMIKGLGAFNVVFDINRKLNTVNIWTYDDYIAAGKVVDWTSRVVRDDNIKHENIGQSRYSELKFEWATDSADQFLTSINDTDKQHLGTYNEKINEAIGDKAVQLHKSPFAPTGMRKTDVDLWMPTVTLNDEDAKIKPRMLLHLNSQFVSNSFLVDGAGPSIFASAVPEVYFYKEDATPDDLVLTFNNMHDKDLRGQTQDVGLVDRLWKNKVNRFFYGKYVTMEMLLSYFDFDGAELNNTITINDNRYTLVKLDKFNLTRQTTTSVELIQQ